MSPRGARLLLVALVFIAKVGLAAAETPLLLFVGGAEGATTSAVLERLTARLESVEPTRTTVVFLGNYASGPMPSNQEPGRARIEREVLVHVEATRAFVKAGGRVYFVPGPNDFPDEGTRSVRRLRRFLNDAYGLDDDRHDDFDDVMPMAECGFAETIELSDDVGLLLVNSQWWVRDWQLDRDANEACELKNRRDVLHMMGDELNAYRRRMLVVASHHPLRSLGPLGGHFTADAHLTPVLGAGSAAVLAKQLGLVEQHLTHPMVRSFSESMLSELQRTGRYVMASGHERSLEVLHVEQQLQLVAGATSLIEPVVDAEPGDFARAALGWVELEVTDEGTAAVRVMSDEQPVFETTFEGNVHQPSNEDPGPLPTEVRATYTTRQLWEPGFLEPIVGSYYSEAFHLELPYPAIDLEQEGLTVKGLGGGFQTNSLKLIDRDGAEWAMRAVTKQTSRVFPWPMNQTYPALKIVEQGFMATHPEAALAVPHLAEAVGVLHPTPRLVFLPDQRALGDLREVMGNELVLFERKPKKPKQGALPESIAGAPSAHGETTFRDMTQTLEKLRDDPAEHRVDQEAMLRARLLDLFLADWDRHQGQWAFAVTPNADGTKTYRPIATDRDQAMANYDGLGLAIARLIEPSVRVLQPFTEHYAELTWLAHGARDIDPLLLNQLDHERWMALARDVQAALTDEVIDGAFADWHDETLALQGKEMARILKVRRDRLLGAAEDFFRLINRDPEVLGTEHDDRLELTFHQGGGVALTLARKKDGVVFFSRTFDPRFTQELRVYALDGDDEVVVHGNAPTSIVVRLVGGRGDDRLEGDPVPEGIMGVPAIHAYDAPEGMRFARIWVHDERSTDASLNQYEASENHEENSGALVPASFLPRISLNPDQGFFVGGGVSFTVQGFKKSPYASRHVLQGAFAANTLGFELGYSGDFPRSLGALGQRVELTVRSPTFTRNFFGYTNRFTPYPDDEGGSLCGLTACTSDNYYRVKQATYGARYGWTWESSSRRLQLSAQLIGELQVIDDTLNRFVGVSPDVRPIDFGAHPLLGVQLKASFSTLDNVIVPRRGVFVEATADPRHDLRTHESWVTLKLGGGVAVPFDRHQRVVLLSRVVVEGITGSHPFFVAPTLGNNELRAYRFQQLAGDFAVAHTSDLRVDVWRFETFLPSTIGVVASADHGRVFGATISDDTYHFIYGGGLWWSMLDLFGVKVTYHRGLGGGSRLMFNVGAVF